MPDYLHLPIGEKATDLVTAVIEIPMGATQKYEYDEKLQVFRLDRTLFSPVHYPGDYGFIPSTCGDDGDPLDVLVLVDTPSFTGCVETVRPIGMLEMIDQGERDAKLLAVVSNDPRYAKVNEYTELFPHTVREIEHFFTIYKDLEGKQTKIVARHDAAAARETIRESHRRFRKAA